MPAVVEAAFHIKKQHIRHIQPSSSFRWLTYHDDVNENCPAKPFMIPDPHDGEQNEIVDVLDQWVFLSVVGQVVMGTVIGRKQ